MPRFALAIRDHEDAPLRFLLRGAFKGNLMPTMEPLDAWTWGDADLVKRWFETLTSEQQAQLQGKELFTIPITASVGEPEASWRVRVTGFDEEKKRDVRAIEEQVHEADEARGDPGASATPAQAQDGRLFG